MLRHPAFNVFHNLIQTSVEGRKPEARRARVLAVTLLILFFLVLSTLAEVILAQTGLIQQEKITYSALIACLLVVLGMAFVLNSKGNYMVAAGLTVTASILGPWGSIFLDKSVLQGEFIPLAYISLSLFLSAILLPVRATVIISIAQLLALVALTPLVPRPLPLNWVSLIAFIVFTSVISIVSTIITRADMEQIDHQNTMLAESEEVMRELSNRDSLTGLFNRRFMEQILVKELDEAKRSMSSLGIIMVDVDHFKSYNDTYGHIEGDALIRLVSHSLRSHIRKTDFVSRYGGDEFILILPGASLNAARQRAEILLKEVRNIQIENKEDLPEIATISMGIAIYPENGGDVNELLRAADLMLYRAKNEGRNRVASSAA